MGMENYVVSLELAKELKEVGFPQNDGEWYWIQVRLGYKWEWKLYLLANSPYAIDNDKIRAPLVEEITKELPDHIAIERDGERKKYWLNIEVYKEGCRAGYRTDPATLGEMPEWLYVSDVYPKLSDALAQLWLWAYERGYLEERDED